MWLVVLPLVLAVGLVCGDAPSPLQGAHTPPANEYTSPSRDYMSTPDSYTLPPDSYTLPPDSYTSPTNGFTSPSDGFTYPPEFLLPWDTHVMPSHAILCPVAENIAPCVCTVKPWGSMYMGCADVGSEDQLAQIFTEHFPFKNITTLSIYNTQNLKVLRSGVFGDVTFQAIEIYGPFVEVQEGVLSGSFTTAEAIDIRQTNISSFPFTELEGFSNLQRFSFDKNNIQDFPSLNSSTLKNIDFSYNPITHLPATGLQEIPNLRFCILAHMGISQMESGTFSGLPILLSINLHNNTIQHIPTGSIQLNTKPTWLSVAFNLPQADLSNNRISSIDVGAVTGLKRLHLSNNLLEELDEAVFRPILDEGTQLYIGGNPLKCGCDIAWLITNQMYMDQLPGNEINLYATCRNGTKLKDLDPQFYEHNC